MAILFYTSPTSIGVATHIALEESGLDYELVEIDFTKQQQSSSDYLKINPKARVPSLLVEDGVLTETPAILTYIAQLAPNSSLKLPSDPFQFAAIQSFNSYLSSTVHVAHAHNHRGARWADDPDALKAMTAYVPKSLSACFALIESSLIKGPWVHGQKFSISDPYLFRMASWMEADGVDIAQYPRTLQHWEAMAQRKSVRTVLDWFS